MNAVLGHEKAGTDPLVHVLSTLKTRALAPERSLARVCQAAGATMRYNARLRDMNLTVTAQDDRAIEVVASGLSSFFGAKLAVDISTVDRTAHLRLSSNRRRRVFMSERGERKEVL